ncbi:MAG TPA: FAD-dependent oxidoreductase [Actinophytocola sp.]|uniref:NAD(P)/FAD-dependent oxidoreductase n=1 Tax=Actinophytocola sp. TaxID=1872138 RepID=UPI002F93B437
MSTDERIVVVGTGGAGLRAAERVRELDFAGELVIIGEEPYRPYHRPMLSKQVLTGTIRPRDVLLPTHSDLDAMWRPKTRAARLDTEEHIVYLPGGEEIDYDGLIIATGLQPAHLPGAPRHDPRVHVLRTVADAVAVQKLLAHGKGRVALIGGGFLAGEVASAARELGRDTTIIIREPTMLDHIPGFDVSETVTALQEANGVRLVTDATVQHWYTDSAQGVTMHLSTGEVVVADCVVLCVGGVPATDWLRGSGLLIDDGVLCGPTTHAHGVDDVVVAGDVARWPNLRFDTVPRRVEHWLNAVEMGRAAADALLAGREMAEPYTPLPKFWSEQHGVRIQGAGIPALAQDTVSLTEAVPISAKITGYVASGSLVGILAWDSPRGMLHYTHVLNHETTQDMRRRMAERTEEEAAPRVEPVARTRQARPVPPTAEKIQPMPQPAMAADVARQLPVRPPIPRPAMVGQPSIPAMNPVLRSNPGMPPAHPSIPSMPPATQSSPGMPPAQQSSPGMPPAMQSSPGMPPAMRSNPGMPPAHPSIPSMPPAHPSIPSMPPAQQSSPGMSPAMRSNPGMPPATHSSPGMPPARPNPGAPRARQSSPGMPPARPNPGMPRAQQSSPGMPPARPNPGMPRAQQSSPGMPPARPGPGMPRAQQSSPGMPPATQSSPGMPPAQQSSPGMPPARGGRPPQRPDTPMYSPLHASMTGPLPGPVPDPVPAPIYDPPGTVDPAQYTPPLSGPADSADPAIMELPPIDAWRKAS